jgi:hypothetical protein
MTPAEREDIKLLIAVYEERGADWSIAAEYLIRRYHGSLPWQEYSPPRRGRRAAAASRDRAMGAPIASDDGRAPV